MLTWALNIGFAGTEKVVYAEIYILRELWERFQLAAEAARYGLAETQPRYALVEVHR